MAKFIERLDNAASSNRSLLSIGIDPAPSSMPIDDIAAFTTAIIEATSDLVCAYKPQMAFFEAEGIAGLRALEATIRAIPSNIPIILDAKRGDIGNTSAAYAKAAFEVWGADAITVSPYMGTDSVDPFTAYSDRGVFVLTRTSNPGGSDFEDKLLVDTNEPLYIEVTRRAIQWNSHGNVGLVVGATTPDELTRVRDICGDMPILIPGIGAQGGDLESSISNGVDRHGRRAIINVARGVIYASSGADFAEAARREATQIRDNINTELDRLGYPWE